MLLFFLRFAEFGAVWISCVRSTFSSYNPNCFKCIVHNFCHFHIQYGRRRTRTTPSNCIKYLSRLTTYCVVMGQGVLSVMMLLIINRLLPSLHECGPFSFSRGLYYEECVVLGVTQSGIANCSNDDIKASMTLSKSWLLTVDLPVNIDQCAGEFRKILLTLYEFVVYLVSSHFYFPDCVVSIR